MSSGWGQGLAPRGCLCEEVGVGGGRQESRKEDWKEGRSWEENGEEGGRKERRKEGQKEDWKEGRKWGGGMDGWEEGGEGG